MKTFYAYIWLREDGTPHYVGKGHHGNTSHEKRAFRKGSPPRDRIILQEYESEQDALAAERFLIALYGRKNNSTGILRNLTDGGEGTCGIIYSEEDRKRRGRPGRAPWNKGKIGCFKLPEEAKKKISAANSRRIWTEESKRKNSASKMGSIPWMRGKRHAPESIEAMRRAHIGHVAWNKESEDQCLRRLFQVVTRLTPSWAV